MTVGPQSQQRRAEWPHPLVVQDVPDVTLTVHMRLEERRVTEEFFASPKARWPEQKIHRRMQNSGG